MSYDRVCQITPVYRSTESKAALDQIANIQLIQKYKICETSWKMIYCFKKKVLRVITFSNKELN